MAGHSKWKNIMHKKGKTDAQRAKVFAKIGKEISIAVRDGGSDPDANAKLRDLIQKAKANNVPNDNIDRVIKKAEGGEGEDYEEIVYEGYGPSGIAVIVETTTDNRNRTGADMRHYFDKYGGNLGTTGCVSFMFSDKGIIAIKNEDIDEEQLFEDAIEAGAEDIVNEVEVFEVITSSTDLESVRSYLSDKGYEFITAEVEKVPANYVSVTDAESVEKMNKLLEMLEDNDDVQEIWHNWEMKE